VICSKRGSEMQPHGDGSSRLPQESERSGQSGGGKKVGSATLLDAAHQHRASRDQIVRVASSSRVPLVSAS
jgi:hypothetical protein